MKVLLVLRVEFGPDDLFKAIWFCVNEFGVLGDRKVWVAGGGEREKNAELMRFPNVSRIHQR